MFSQKILFFKVGRRYRKVFHLCTGSFPKWLQWVVLVHFATRSFILVSHESSSAPHTWAIVYRIPRPLAGSWAERVVKTQVGVHMGFLQSSWRLYPLSYSTVPEVFGNFFFFLRGVGNDLIGESEREQALLSPQRAATAKVGWRWSWQPDLPFRVWVAAARILVPSVVSQEHWQGVGLEAD